MAGLRDAVVVIPGTRWEDTQGTDHRLAEALAGQGPVLWVDPPVPCFGPAAVSRPRRLAAFRLDELHPGLTRLRYLATPGFTRPGLDALARWLRDAALGKALSRLGLRPAATLLLSPRDSFPAKSTGRCLLHVTDDWVSGAALMGLDRSRVQALLRRNLQRADQASAVSPHLADAVSALLPGRTVRTVPNGCRPLPPETALDACGTPGQVVLLGQLNERLDLDVLDALAEAGLRLEVIGPRRERDAQVAARLDRFLAAPTVRWHGEVPPDEVPWLIGGASVGITPYLDNEFNKASFPLKTLDYLAAGLPVISTDSPAVRWLDTELVQTASGPADFVRRASELAGRQPGDLQRRRRVEFARQHSWEARAAALLAQVEVAS